MSSIRKNYIYSVLYQILASIVPLVTSPYIARTIGAEGLGLYSYQYSIAHYFSIFIILGLMHYGCRAIAAVKEDEEQRTKVFWEIYFMQLILGVIFVSLYVIYVAMFDQKNMLISVLMVLYLASVMLDITWMFYGLEEFKYTTIRNSVIKILNVLFVFVFVKDAEDTWIYTIIMVVGHLLSQVFLWPRLIKYVGFKMPSFKNVFKHLKPNFMLFIPIIAINIYKFLDKIMLGAMVNTEQVGFFENAEKVILIPMGFITSFGQVMLPKVSGMYATGKENEAKKYLKMSFHFVTVITLAMAFGLAAVSRKFAILFWGGAFEVSGKLIAILAVSMIFVAWPNIIRAQYLIPAHKEKEYIFSVFMGAAVNFTVNLILIKEHMAVGTAIGTICAEMAVCVCQVWCVRKEIPFAEIIKQNIIFIIPGVVMFGAVSFISSVTAITIPWLLLEIVVGAVIYCGLALMLEYIFNRELLTYIKKNLLKR